MTAVCWPHWWRDPLLSPADHQPLRELNPVVSAIIGRDLHQVTCRCNRMTPVTVPPGPDAWNAYADHMRDEQDAARRLADTA